jgi:hypothetical protein
MALGANRSNVVYLVMSRSLLRVAIISGPSLSKACLVAFHQERSEDVVHFRTVSKQQAIQKTALEEINGDLLEADFWGVSEILQTCGLATVHVLAGQNVGVTEVTNRSVRLPAGTSSRFASSRPSGPRPHCKYVEFRIVSRPAPTTVKRVAARAPMQRALQADDDDWSNT